MGTSVTNLMLTMLDPSSITNQLMFKYTGEIQLLEKGHYKFDKIRFLQDYRGWRPKIKKIPIEHNTFDKWPNWVYEEYDAIRMSLVPEVFQRIRDAEKRSRIDDLLELTNSCDVAVLRKIAEHGPIKSVELITFLNEQQIDGKQTVNRCKSRSIINPVKCGDNYWKLELGFLGNEILKALDKDKDLEHKVQSRKPFK